MINNDKHQRGFTLLEVIITTLIASLLIGTITSFLVVSVKSYNTNKSIVELQYQAQVTLNTMIDAVMYSQGVEDVSEEDTNKIGLRITLDKEAGTYGYYLLNDKQLYYIEDTISTRKGVLIEIEKVSTEESIILPSLESIWQKYDIDLNPKEHLIATHVESMILTVPTGAIQGKSIGVELIFSSGSANLTVFNQATARN